MFNSGLRQKNIKEPVTQVFPLLFEEMTKLVCRLRIAGIPFIYAKYGFGENYGRGKTGDYDAAIESLSELSDAVGAVPASDKEG